MPRARRAQPVSAPGWLLLLAVLLGCAGSYYEQYRREHPDWVPAFPDPQANLEQTVASLYAPPVRDTRLTIRRLEILRRDGEAWEVVELGALRDGAYRSDATSSYAVIADFVCQGQVGLRSYHGEKIGFYLLPENRLAAYDHYAFIEGCTVHNDFEPATGDLVLLEESVQARIAESYPTSMVHVSEIFRKGMAYVEAGRLDDARRMLHLGSAGFDVSADQSPRFETPGVQIQLADRGRAESARLELMRAIARAEEAEAEGAGG